MEKLKDIFTNIFFSAMIGIFIGMIGLIAKMSTYTGYKIIMNNLLLSGLIGICIGFVAEFVFKLFARKVFKNIKKVFILEILIVSVISFTASYLMGIKNIYFLIIMTLFAAFLALIFSITQYNRAKYVNNKLREIQERNIKPKFSK